MNTGDGNPLALLHQGTYNINLKFVLILRVVRPQIGSTALLVNA